MYNPRFSLIHISTSTHLASSNDLLSYLNHFSVDPLPHFNSTMSHQHRPIQINVNQGSSLSKKKKKKTIAKIFLIDIIIYLIKQKIFPLGSNPSFPSLPQYTQAPPPSRWAEPGQALQGRASPSLDGCDSGRFMLLTILFPLEGNWGPGTFKDPSEPRWNNNLSLGVLRERPSVLNAKSCIDCLGEKGKTCLREHISLQL